MPDQLRAVPEGSASPYGVRLTRDLVRGMAEQLQMPVDALEAVILTQIAARHVFPELDDPEWLATEYRTNGRSAADIAKGLGCSRKRVRTALARHDIRVRRRGAGRAFPELGDADWLRDQFVTKNRTRSEIAADVGCATMSVTRALRAAGLVP
jgi:hypothetical protein